MTTAFPNEDLVLPNETQNGPAFEGSCGATRSEIEAASAGNGKGSAFTFGAPGSTELPATAETGRKTNAVDVSELRLLIVEDNADARELLRLLLEYEGYKVNGVGDGRTAVDAILSERPHVAFVDIGLPGFDGYEVARRVRQQLSVGEVRLIALTGYVQDSDRERSREAGFDHHLNKPVEVDQLRELLGDIACRCVGAPSAVRSLG